MLLDTDETSSTNASSSTSRATTSTPRSLLAIIDLFHRAKKLHEQEPTSLVPRSILRDLVSALHYRDENTFLHSQRVGQLAVGLAKHLCWNEEAQFHLEIASLLHDIGKIGLPDHLLYKPGRFTGDETSLMALGTEVANNILQICYVKPDLRRTIIESRMSYSFLEDQGRPLEKEISLAGRLLAVVDVYESLSRNQVYRNAYTHEQIIAHLNERAGTQFDPNIVTALIRWLKPETLAQIQSLNAQQPDPNKQGYLQGSIATTSLCHLFTDLYNLESSFDGILIVDANQEIVLLSRGLQSLFKQNEEMSLLREWTADSFPMKDSHLKSFPIGCYPLERATKTKLPLTVNINLPDHNGNWAETSLQSLPLVDFKCQFQGVVEFYKYKNPHIQKNAQYRELALQASRDALTGVANRGEMEVQLSKIMVNYESDPTGGLFSIIYLDIDHFKNVNDTYGHAVGDEVLVNLARMLQREAHSCELVARYGGEEFVIICPGLQIMQAAGRAERFRLEIAKLKFASEPGLTITSSFGISQSEPGDCLESILKRADQALYQSKHEGRNRTTILEKKSLGQANSQTNEKKASDKFTFYSEMNCMIHKEILLIKLKGYVQEHEAKLLEIEQGKAVIQLGNKGFFSKWGKKIRRQPIRIEIDASDALKPSDTKSKKSKIKVYISPIGRPDNRETFLHRARSAFHEMSYHFLSE